MAYYKVRIEVWCDWNPAESDLDDIAQAMGVGEAICTMREVIAVVNRPQDIEDEAERSHCALRQAGGAAFAVTEGSVERLVLVFELKPD